MYVKRLVERKVKSVVCRMNTVYRTDKVKTVLVVLKTRMLLRSWVGPAGTWQASV